ncbi:MAG: hypothetical protein D6754_10420, partial [Alphaproteobacteria bacterium]
MTGERPDVMTRADPAGAVRTGREGDVSRALQRLAPGTGLAESLTVDGVDTRRLIEALRAEVCPGALIRSTPGGWALDWPEVPGLAPLWRGLGPGAAKGPALSFPDDEQAAGCLRLLDAVALRLGLGRGHVRPIFENPARRAIEMQAFCDLPSLESGTVQDRVAGFLDLGVPVAAILVLRHEGGAHWKGLRPPLRWGRALLTPGRLGQERIEDRLPAEYRDVDADGYLPLLARPLRDGVAVKLPAGLDLDALGRLLAALETAAAQQEQPVLIEGEITAEGLVSLLLEPGPAGIRLELPALRAVADAATLVRRVLGAVAGLGGHVVPARRQTAITLPESGAQPLLVNLLAHLLAHPVLMQLRQDAVCGPYSPACRPDERPGAVAARLRAMLSAAPEWLALPALAACLQDSAIALEGERLVLTGTAASGAEESAAWLELLGACAATGSASVEPELPLAAYRCPTILAADLQALLDTLAAAGFALDPAPLEQTLDRIHPVLAADEAAGLTLRRAVTGRDLPGDWTAMALEARLDGAGEAARLLVRAGLDGQ